MKRNDSRTKGRHLADREEPDMPAPMPSVFQLQALGFSGIRAERFLAEARS